MMQLQEEYSRVSARPTAVTTAMSFCRLQPVVLAAGLFFVMSGDAQASSTVQPSILAGSCANCHGTDGRSSGSIPSIAGVPYAVLLAKLNAFKTNPAPDATVMPRLMRAYDAAQIEQLARYFSDIKPGAAR